MDLYLHEDLLKAENQDDLLAKTQRVVEKLEYDNFSYYFRSYGSSCEETIQPDIGFGSVRDDYIQYYIESGAETFDPSFRLCFSCTTPVIRKIRIQNQVLQGCATMNKHEFAVCIDNQGYEVSLETRKLYEVLADEKAALCGQIRVIDESGEDYLYPQSMFDRISLPDSITEHLLVAHA